MKIGIIGMGFVGSAIAWAHRRQDVIFYDPAFQDSCEFHELNNCSAIYVCVPTPADDIGRCDSSILESTIDQLLLVTLNKQVPIICKSTAPPSVYEKLHARCPSLVHSPEFLTAKDAIADYQNSEFVILGGHDDWCIKARQIIKMGLNKPDYAFLVMDVKTASLYKYMANGFLATKVTFANDFAQLAEAEGVEWSTMIEIAAMDSRIGRGHLKAPGEDGQYGWGGHCFPKDVAAIIEEGLSLGVDLELLGRVEDLNKKHRKL